VLDGPAGLAVVAAADAARTFALRDAGANAAAMHSLLKLREAADLVLLDMRNDTDEPSAFAAAVQDVIVVVSTASASITGGYAALKRISRTSGRKRFHLLVNCADDARVAQQVQANIASAASKHLGVYFEYFGAVPRDPALGNAAGLLASCSGGASTAPGAFHAQAAAISRSSAPQKQPTPLDNLLQRAIYGKHAVGAGV
jgi:MinD-like ATPase involved in chromosome partitioning or flagellar assembly